MYGHRDVVFTPFQVDLMLPNTAKWKPTVNSALTSTSRVGGEKDNQNGASNGPSSKKNKTKQTNLQTKKCALHEEWQIVVLVQFDTGMIACMFVRRVCVSVCVFKFLAAEPKDVSSEHFVWFLCHFWLLTRERAAASSVVGLEAGDVRGVRKKKKARKQPCFYSEGFSVD